jgi:hypothetical protein
MESSQKEKDGDVTGQGLIPKWGLPGEMTVRHLTIVPKVLRESYKPEQILESMEMTEIDREL